MMNYFVLLFMYDIFKYLMEDIKKLNLDSKIAKIRLKVAQSVNPEKERLQKTSKLMPKPLTCFWAGSSRMT